MPTPPTTRSGKRDFSSPSLAALGPTVRPESSARSLSRLTRSRCFRSSLLRSGANITSARASSRPACRRPRPTCGPSSWISTSPAGLTASTMRLPSWRRSVGQQRRVHRDVRDAEVARQQLHVRQRVAGPRRQDAGHRRQLGHGLRQQVDAVGTQATDRLHVGVRIQHAARQTGVQRGEAGTDLAAHQPVLHAGSAVGVARQRVQSLRIGQQRAAAQLVLDEQIGHRLDGRELVHRLAEMLAQRLRSPGRQQAQRPQRGQVLAQLESRQLEKRAQALSSSARSRAPIRPVP